MIDLKGEALSDDQVHPEGFSEETERGPFNLTQEDWTFMYEDGEFRLSNALTEKGWNREDWANEQWMASFGVEAAVKFLEERYAPVLAAAEAVVNSEWPDYDIRYVPSALVRDLELAIGKVKYPEPKGD